MRGSVYLVMELMAHDLSGVFDFNIRFNLPQTKCVAFQLLQGLKYLHDKNVLHRDIKGANILMNNKGSIKLADFGLARYKTQQKQYTNRVVTLWYRAPELLLGQRNYDHLIDVWSVGCFLFELYAGKPLFGG
jgi:serine/threonine protein kinase